MNEAVRSELLVLVWRRARTSIECVQENECAIEGVGRGSRISPHRERMGAVRGREVFSVMLENI